MPVRIGVLGCGGIARAAHLPSLARTPDASVIALADADAANLASAQPLAPLARGVRDYAAVLDMPDVDAVVIALPPALHADAAIAALRHGKHIYVEKPLATSVGDGTRVVEAWQTTGLVAMMGFNYRYNPMIAHARARLAARAVGEVVAVRTVFATQRRSTPEWKRQRESGGGVLLDLAVHHVDLVRFLLAAEISQVSADVRSVASEHDTAFLQLRLTNGATAQTICSLSAVEEDRIEIYGSTGKLTIDRYGSLRVDETGADARGALGVAVTKLIGEVRALPYALEKRRAPLHDPSFPMAMEAFVRAVRGGTAATPTLGDGLRALAVIDAAEQSARSGHAVTLDAPVAAVTPNRAPMSPEPSQDGPHGGRPALSVVLITPDSFETLRRTVECVVAQTARDRIELVIIAPKSARIDIDRSLVAPLAGVQVVALDSLTPTGPARAAGVRAARAPVVAFGEEHCFPAPTWAAALIEAHRGDYAAVGPAIHNANPDTIVSWADLLIGYGPWAAPVAKREAEFLPGHNSSYKRAVLLEYGDRLDTLMEAETVLMWDLRAKGHRLLLDPTAQTAHMNFGYWSSWVPAMFLNGRAFADTRAAGWPLVKRLVFVAASPVIPLVRFARTFGHARRLGRGAGFLARVVPTLGIGLVADGIGQMAGYALGAGDAHARMAEYEWHRTNHTPLAQSPRTT
jgi:predicted dehydrogenase